MKQIIDESIFFNLWKNRYWVSIGVLTITIAVWLEYQQRRFFVGKLVMGFPYRHMGDPYMPVVIGFVGTFSLILGLWDIHTHQAKLVNLWLLEVMWITITISDFERQLVDHQSSILVYLGAFICITAWLEFVAPSVMAMILKHEEKMAKVDLQKEAHKQEQAQTSKKKPS